MRTRTLISFQRQILCLVNKILRGFREIHMNPKNVFYVLFVLAILSFTFLCSDDLILSYAPEEPANTMNPIISDLKDMRYYMGMGKPPPILNWSVEGHSPDTYRIYVNSKQVESGSWENGTISWSIGNIPRLNIGVFNITIVIQDIYENKASDVVIVEV